MGSHLHGGCAEVCAQGLLPSAAWAGLGLKGQGVLGGAMGGAKNRMQVCAQLWVRVKLGWAWHTLLTAAETADHPNSIALLHICVML